MILNIIATAVGWITLLIGSMWLIGQFIIWLFGEIKVVGKQKFLQELQQTLDSLTHHCHTEYPEIEKCCEVISSKMSGKPIMSPQQFLTWLRKYQPKM